MLGWLSLKAVGWLMVAGGYCTYRWLMHECHADDALMEQHVVRSKQPKTQDTPPVEPQPMPRVRALLPGEVSVAPPSYRRDNQQGDQSV